LFEDAASPTELDLMLEESKADQEESKEEGPAELHDGTWTQDH
jgi:hypothetical protein